MTHGYADKETRRIAAGERSRRLPFEIQQRAFDLLQLISAAAELSDLASQPSNRLHVLRGNRAGQHSISINMQWRICFVWRDGGADDVEITDYH